MRVANFGGKKWAIDLEWELMPNAASFRQEIKTIVVKTSKPYGVIVQHDGASAVGLSKKSSKLSSAAAMLAAANQKLLLISSDSNPPSEDAQNDWIVIELLAENEYWLCVIKNGVPLPGTADTIHTLKDLQNQVTDLLEVDTYKIFSPLNEIKDYMLGVKNVDEAGVAELTKGISTKYKLKKLTGIPPVAIYVMAGLFIVGAGYFAINAFLENEAMQKKVVELQKQKLIFQQSEQIEAQRANVEYEKMVNVQKDKQLSKLYAGISGDPKVLLPGWINNIADLSYPVFGWDMTKVDCVFNYEAASLNERPSCSLFLKRGKYGTTRMLLDEIPNAQVNGNEAEVKLEFSDIPVELLANRALDKIVLPDAALFAKVVISQVQAAEAGGITNTIKPAVDAIFYPPSRPLTKAQVDAGEKPVPVPPVNLGFAEGELLLRGKNIVYLNEIFENMNLMAMSLTRFRVDFASNGATWEANFKYFLKLNNGMGMSTSGSLPPGSLPPGVSASSVTGAPPAPPALPMIGLPGAPR